MRRFVLSLLLANLLSCAAPDSPGEPSLASDAGARPGTDGGGQAARYFIAIHNEPHHPGGEARILASYELLRQMVKQADAASIKLTIMLSAQWADLIVRDSQRLAEVRGWKAAGHELAAHHHSIYHGNWDGYTDYTPAEAAAERLRYTASPEPYLGTLADFMARLRAVDPEIQTGCLNDEADRAELADGILIDTCSGFANRGEVGRREADGATTDKGKNEFISTGLWKGVERRWLTHAQVHPPDGIEKARRSFSDTRGAYGVVVHSSQQEQETFTRLLELFRSSDPEGALSRTLSTLVAERALPEKTIPAALLEQKLVAAGHPR